jgi:hypothetical protein
MERLTRDALLDLAARCVFRTGTAGVKVAGVVQPAAPVQWRAWICDAHHCPAARPRCRGSGTYQ